MARAPRRVDRRSGRTNDRTGLASLHGPTGARGACLVCVMRRTGGLRTSPGGSLRAGFFDISESWRASTAFLLLLGLSTSDNFCLSLAIGELCFFEDIYELFTSADCFSRFIEDSDGLA